MFCNCYEIIKNILKYFNTKYTITSQRIVIRKGILNISSYQIELFRLKDFWKHQNLWARLCGYVNVEVISSDRYLPEAYLRGLPNARYITEHMRMAAQAARSQSGFVYIRE
jgi:uncharacterized membrane protein YdbT with pleckstrin-like domain